jgi:hypothetical protein
MLKKAFGRGKPRQGYIVHKEDTFLAFQVLKTDKSEIPSLKKIEKTTRLARRSRQKFARLAKSCWQEQRPLLSWQKSVG